jgi:hypothetical protein
MLLLVELTGRDLHQLGEDLNIKNIKNARN